jgi:NitT/TauT family transport system substrate-binding protein
MKKIATVSRRGLALAAAGLFLGLTGLPAKAADDVTLRINFTPWGMHSAFFAGVAQGFYEAEGINLTILPPSAGQQNEVFIGTGREQFGLANADSFIKARASGLPVVAIMADQPDTPFAVMTLQTSGLDTPASLKGKKLSWFQTNVRGLVEPLLTAGGLGQNDIEFVSVARGAEVQMIAAGQVDAIFGYGYGQGLTLESRGFPVNVMPVRDYGVEFYGTVLYTNENLITSDPDLIERFLRATQKAYIWTRDNKRDAVAEVIKVSPDRDLDLETRKLEIIYGLYNSPDYADRFGMMNSGKWQSSIDILAASGDLPNKPQPEDMFTNAFVEKLEEAVTLSKLVRSDAKTN